MSEPTPFMKQYLSVKEQYRDAIVFFRLGDFYEMFGEDAEKAAGILQIALTTRDKGKEDALPMCGIPYFASESYIQKLIRAGQKVAICEQMEDPKEAKGIVDRQIVRVVTPGTTVPENPKENVYLLSVFPSGKTHGIAVADISTGEFTLYETIESIRDELYRFEPKEILIPRSISENIHYTETLRGFYTTAVDDWDFDYSEAYKTLMKHLKVSSLEGYGCEGLHAAVAAAGALISYIEETQRDTFTLKRISALRQDSCLFLDAVTQRNLELVRNLSETGSEGTLLSVLDETLTPMGARFLRSSILKPLIDIAEISKRSNAVEYLTEDFELLEGLRRSLRKVQDVERLSSKLVSKTANARDLIAVRNSLLAFPKIKSLLAASGDVYLRSISKEISPCNQMQEIITHSIPDTPPAGLKDGGIIRDGYHDGIDELRNISKKGKDFIAELEAGERQKTGISSLKVGYNRVFGYYIEITRSNLHMVPDDYIRKQTLVGGERFITPALKEYESKVLGSEERLRTLEYEVFTGILGQLQEEAALLSLASGVLASVDFLASLAVVAKRHAYVKPAVDESGVVDITDGRHPVLERYLTDKSFIPNSVQMDGDENRMLIITGPNMAGKSTYMRQTALMIIMAQMGGFVPAAQARIGIADRIFTRIGAADYLTKGQSTFMVEMIEVANITHHATPRSFIILDEVGRGTSTFDGISIAWALAEYILNELKARTLFATHYNELTELALENDTVRNYNIAVKEWGDEIIFLRKIEKGPADKSYGIQVARLAGLPDSLLTRAKEVLANLEKEELNETGMPKFTGRKKKKGTIQLDLFSSASDAIIVDIRNLDLAKLTPEEALRKLADLKRRAGG